MDDMNLTGAGLGIAGVFSAAGRIRPFIRRTPLEYSLPLSKLLGAEAYLKLENLQVTGSFKVRGAASRMLLMTGRERESGVISASSGNHAQAVAMMAARLGIDAMIVVPESAPQVKIENTRRYGAAVVVTGADYDESEVRAWEIQKRTGRTYIHAFIDPQVVAGQGTVGLELMEERPAIQQVLVPAGGGGLAIGVAIAVKSINPSAQVIGVTSDTSPAWTESRRAGRVVNPPVFPTLADGTAGGIAEYTFDLAASWVDDFILVSEQDIRHAVAWMLDNHHYIIEGAAALGLAAVLSAHPCVQKLETAVVLTGQNIDTAQLLTVLAPQIKP